MTPTRHAEIVTRWLAAGTVIFGRTNTPEFGAKAVTEPAAFRATCNPWRLTHSAGGSSGGAAAAVAAGIVPMAGASDGGGSIRIPASSTGLFGLKPGRGRTPNGPEQTEPLHGAVVNHVLSWSVRDSAHMLDATHGPERGGPFVIAPPERPYAEEVVRDPPRLRIAFSTASPIGADVHPEAVRAVEQAAHSLRGLGHEVDEAAPEIDGRALARDFCRIWFANLAWHVEHARDTWQATDADFELESLMLGAIAAATSAPAYVASYNRWNEYAGQLATFLGTYDLYMTPTLALPPPPLGERAIPKSAEALLRVGLRHGLARVLPRATKLIEQVSFETLRGVPFTQLANVCGVPAMSVPLATFSDGMPLGIQFVGDHGDEGMLLSLAAQLERAQPWKDRRPAL